MHKIITVALISLLASGCSVEKTAEEIAVGKLRHSLFVECMELAAKMTRQSDDDVSSIVYECSNQSNYMANHMSK
jgi:hypothetical protein